MRTVRRSLALLVVCLGFAIACGDEAGNDDGAPGGNATVTGGGSGRAGAAGRGGTTPGGAAGASAGRGGANSTGGMPGSGGTLAPTGGTSGANGGTTGGSSGSAATAGSNAGGSDNGGNAGSGGSNATGGSAAGDAGAAGTANAGSSGSDGAGGATAGSGGAGGSAGTNAGAGGASGSSGAAGAGGGGQQGLPPGVTALFPGPSATNVCRDPQLRIGFASPPTLGNSGQVRVFDSAGAAVASVNMASTTTSDSIGGQTFSLLRPAYVDGNTAIVYLPSRALTYGKTYYVTVDAGAIVPPGGGSFSLTGNSAWRFSTAAAAPSSLAVLDVALDGSGDFCSVQGAIDALPNNNSAAARINIAAGTYHEVIYFTGKNNVTLHGADRHGTVIAATNNNNMNPSTKGRALVGVDSSSNLIVENLTIHNLTPQGGSQAEALRVQNCTHCVVRDADILSLQDTLLWSGTVYAKNCYIAGNVDFVWGTGTAYFDSCEIKTVGRQGVVVQARNGTSGYGYVFVDSRITADAGITNSTLARIDVSAYPGSHVAYIDCTLGSHITGAGWTITGGSPGSSLRFWEYQSRNLDGNLINTSQRVAGSTQISASQAASMRDKATVLGGWTPPN